MVQRETATAASEQETQEPADYGHSFGSMSLFAEAFDAGAPAAPSAPSAPSGPLDPPDFPIQASLRINAPGDVFEQEADQMASAVMGMSSEGDAAPAGPGLQVQRAASSHDGGLETSPAVDASIAQMQGGGQPLPSGERSFFENRFGHDFSQIRIHADTHAAQTAQSLNARAFTVGNDIAFDAGEYQPGTSSGRHLLAHELTHTIQQTGGVATKRVQRKEDEPEQAEEAPESEEEAPQQSPADLVALAQQTLTEDEVSAQAVAPVEAQPVELPETVIEDEGGGGGGGGGAAEAAPAEAALAVAEQKLAEAEKAALVAQTAPGGAAAASQPAPQPAPESAPQPASAGNSPAAGTAAEATQAASEAAPAEQKTEQKTETAPGGETTSATAGGEPNAPSANPQSATANQPEAKAAEDRNGTAQQSPEDEQAGKREQPEDEQAGKREQTGAVQQAEAEPDEDEERATTVQRMPAGHMIQRAPRSPDADPAFQAVTANVKTTAVGQKQHDPAKQKADESAAAAKMPQEEKLGAAQNTQTTVIDSAAAAQQQQAADGSAPGFDKAAFKAQVKARIDELTPKDPKEMEDIEGSGVFGNVQSAVNEKVETGKDQAQGNVDDKVNETPDPSAVPDKPTNPLQPNAPGQAPGAVDATGAAPKPHDPAEVEVPLQQESQGLDTKMASAQVTPEQLQKSNEPQFQTALEAKTSAQTHVTEALPQYRTKEQGQIQGAQAEASTLTQTGVGGMFQNRTGSFGQMDTLQKGAQTKDEQERARIGQEINAIYQSTKTAVEGILTELDTAVDQCFTSGADRAKQAAIDYIKRETDAYKERRYSGEDSGWGVVGGLVNRVDDGLTGMPDEYFEYYRQGRDLYVAEMDGVLDQVADIVAVQLKRAHDRVQQGRDEITKYVNEQPERLRECAEEAAEDAQGKFDELDETITAKQDEIVDSLAQKYVEKLQALDSELEAMKEAEKGLLAKAADMIEGVIQTIGELKDLLMNTLQRAAGAVMKILQDPIGFLGNLLSAVGQGLRQFAGNIGTHLQQGLISWLTGALAGGGIQLPATWDLQGIFSLVMQILGLTYAQIRTRIVQALGPIGEQVIGALEQAWDVFQIIQSEGLAGLWNFIADQVGDLQAMVLDQIKDMVITQVIQAGIEWLVGILGGPAGAFIKAVQAIVRVVTWFVNNAARLASLVNSVIDSVMAIASGDIGGAANHIEQSLAKALPTVIGFLADLLGLGGISQKVQQIITKVRSPIEKAITWLVQKAVALGKKLWGLLKGKGKGKGKDEDKDKTGEDAGDPTKPGTTPEDERYHGQLADEAISQLQQRPVTEGADFKTARAEKEAQAREIEQTYTAKLKPGIKMTISFEAATESAEADNDLDFTVLIAPNDTKKKASLPFKSVEQQVNVGVRGPDGQVLEQTSLSGKMEDILLKVRQLQFNQTDITAETILQKRNYALANIQVSGHTKGGILVVKTFPITNSQLLSIYSSGTGAVVKEAIKLKVVDANGKQLRAGKLTPEVESIAPELFIAPGAQIVTPETKELTSFIGKLSEALDSRGYVASLDKHSEQAAWQAFRQNDGSIAAMIDECDIVKIVHVSINIHSERQMCPVCAAASNHMISNLASEAPAVFEMLKKKQAMLDPETSVTSTFEFQGSAPNGPSTTRVTEPTGRTRPQNPVTSQTVQDVTSQTFDLSGKVE